jgi:hypothetical protein
MYICFGRLCSLFILQFFPWARLSNLDFVTSREDKKLKEAHTTVEKYLRHSSARFCPLFPICMYGTVLILLFFPWGGTFV